MKHLTEKYVWLVLIAFLLLVAPPSPAQQADKYAKEIKVFKDFVQKQMQVDRIVGLSIGFMKDDYLWAEGFGYANLENKNKATEKTAYRLASVTKPMTAVAVIQLVEKGKIDLDAGVQRYVPYFPKKRWPITVGRLLGHLGGITHYRERWELHIKEPKDTREAIAVFENYDLIAEPGTKYSYSSYGYNLLGAVIEGASKKPYGDYMRQNIWGPLGMNDTRLDSPDDVIPNRAGGYRFIDGKLRNSEFIDISSRFAGGGTRSTVVDLLKFARGLNSGKLLSEKSLDLMSTSMATKAGYFTDYGMGWRLTPVNGHFVISHSGSQAETRTLLVIFPRENFVIAIGCNTEGTNLNPYAQRLFQLILDEPWNMDLYTGDKLNSPVEQGMRDVFNNGFAYFDEHNEPLSKNDEELAKAFAYFNKFVNRNALKSAYGKTRKKIGEGRHPVADHAFLKMGSFMALKLTEKYGPDRVRTYNRMGAISFFNDYIELYKGTPGFPAELRFNEQFEELITKWNKDLRKACDEYVLRLTITPYSDFDDIEKRLKKAFSAAEVYPKFTDQFYTATGYFYLNGEREKAFRVAKLALDLYPRSAAPYVMLANTHICFGERDVARGFYKKALELGVDDRAYISPGRLNRYAYDLAGTGKLDEAIELLKIAVELYPKKANLYDSLGEIYLRKGQKYYQKALEVDTTFDHAREMLKKLKER
jgi:CubicO group peptidase (beta-lactamase class C family)